MNGVIIINAYATDIPRQAERMRFELELCGVNARIMRNNALCATVTDGGVDISDPPDFCVYLDKDKYVARMLEKRGVKLFNRARAIEVCDDKMLTHIALADSGVPMPDTVPGLLCYDENTPLDKAALDKTEALLGYPVVAKLSYGSMGKGVFKADDRSGLEMIAQKLKPFPHLFQRYVSSSHGKDMRVIVIGGRVIGGILRSSNGDFRSNIGLGGKAEKIAVPDDIRKIAIETSRILELDYCGIDFLLGDTPLVCEVNSNAFFDAFEAVTDINVAGEYARHIVDIMDKR